MGMGMGCIFIRIPMDIRMEMGTLRREVVRMPGVGLVRVRVPASRRRTHEGWQQ